MKAPNRAKNSPKWAPLLRAAVGSSCWVSLPWSATDYHSLMRIRKRLGLTAKVAVVGRSRTVPPRIWIGPVSLARVLRAGLRASDCGGVE